MKYTKKRFGQIKKTAKRYGRKAYGAIKKRYSGWNGIRNGVNDIASVAKLAQMINAEKKRYDLFIGSAQVAQYTGAGVSGCRFVQLPFDTGIVQGTTSSTRNGNSIKCSGMIMKFLITQQASAINPIKFKITVFTIKGIPAPANNDLLTRFLNSNPFSGVVDYNSDRDPDNFSDFIILGKKYGQMRGDNITNQTNPLSISLPISFKNKKIKHMRWNNSGSLTELPIYFLMTCDNGDNSVNTGLLVNYNARLYYYDN